ncbi:MAG: lipase family alpha/beta hydrolase [Bryobacteraceae bacterium]
MLVACAFGCDIGAIERWYAECMSEMPPPPPLPPTPVSQSLACGDSGCPAITFVDPVPDLQNGNALAAGADVLATRGIPVTAIAAEDAARVVVRIPAHQVNEILNVSLVSCSGRFDPGTPENDPGVLSTVNGSEKQSPLSVKAQNAKGGPMAFAVYQPPGDFRRDSTDDNYASRCVMFEAKSATLPSTPAVDTPLKLFRPPVVLVHGLWDTPAPLQPLKTMLQGVTDQSTGARFFRLVEVIKYNQGLTSMISSSVPPYDRDLLDKADRSSLGFDYNAPIVLDQIAQYIDDFRKQNSAAAAQADVVVHSMGGVIARTLELLPDYTDNSSFGVGKIHKLITIGTPHFGSPLAIQLLKTNDNSCVRGVLATHGRLSFSSVTLLGYPSKISGAVLDLQGDGVGGSMSQALSKINTTSNDHEAQTSLITAQMGPGNPSGPVPTALGIWCLGDTLAGDLNSTGWPTLFANTDGSNNSDGIVSVTSQGANKQGDLGFRAIHSSGLRDLGFSGQCELDLSSGIPDSVKSRLLAPRTGTNAPYTFYKLSPQ